jgi:dihydroorotase
MIGLETALATCITLGGMGGGWLPVLVERLTAGPYRVLGAAAGLHEPRLQAGEVADCVLFDPDEEWTVGWDRMRSLSRNTPLVGTHLRGRVLLTLVDGHVAFVNQSTVATSVLLGADAPGGGPPPRQHSPGVANASVPPVASLEALRA